MRRIFSGMQPTGNLHLGNYLGALKNWVKLQNEYECFYCAVDLHAITVPQDPKVLKNATREACAAYIAAGIDTHKSTLFVQSAVSAHTELGWILGTITPLGWLNRMTQFKDKSAKSKELLLWGLYSYPVLMAADILLYKATHVPVGEDQKQHVELARDLAIAFNKKFETDYFPVPEPQILGEATRVMSLRDGTKKMSKSDESDYSRINMTDDADMIALKIRKAKTDPEPLPHTIAELEKRPEADNLVTIYAALADSTRVATLKAYAETQFSHFKKDLTDLAVAKLSPITTRMRELLAHPAEIDKVLAKGAEKASSLAEKHMREIKDIVGFWRV
ncbi:MAG: tryptophan--tRNA ligase [Alphaproteobacteria bacterium]|nr:tryptophan--tRNA ligase [Alphaproteobacteria bacterium]